jgi:hypothetical protein
VTFAALAPTGGPHVAWDELGRLLLLELRDELDATSPRVTPGAPCPTAVRATLTTNDGAAHVLGIVVASPVGAAPSDALAAAGPWIFIPILHYETLAQQTGLPMELLDLHVPPGSELCSLATPCASRPGFDPCDDPAVVRARTTLNACLARAGRAYGAAIEAIESFNDEGLTLCLELESDWLRARCTDGVMLWSQTTLVLATKAFVRAIHVCHEAYDAVVAEVVDATCNEGL